MCSLPLLEECEETKIIHVCYMLGVFYAPKLKIVTFHSKVLRQYGRVLKDRGICVRSTHILAILVWTGSLTSLNLISSSII